MWLSGLFAVCLKRIREYCSCFVFSTFCLLICCVNYTTINTKKTKLASLILATPFCFTFLASWNSPFSRGTPSSGNLGMYWLNKYLLSLFYKTCQHLLILRMCLPFSSLNQIGLDKQASEDTRLLYCTTGVLKEKFIGKKNMHEYTHVILDEVRTRLLLELYQTRRYFYRGVA